MDCIRNVMKCISEKWDSLLPSRINCSRWFASSFGAKIILVVIMCLNGVYIPDVVSLGWAVIYIIYLLWGILITVSRLHDMDRSGWWWCLSIIPGINIIFTICVLIGRGTEGSNRFGPQPKESGPIIYALAFSPLIILAIVVILTYCLPPETQLSISTYFSSVTLEK